MASIGLYALLALGIGLVCGLITNVVVRFVRRRSASAANTSDDFDEEDYNSNFLMFSLGFTLVAFIVICFVSGVFERIGY
jgi:predicted histidine transporter YuiF (NhaC family)